MRFDRNNVSRSAAERLFATSQNDRRRGCRSLERTGSRRLSTGGFHRAGVRAIEVTDLTKVYGSRPALRGVSLAVESGEIFGLFGPNGAGKTTLLKILTGQLRPTGGRVSVLGIDPVADGIRVKAAVGIVPEVESPPSYLTAAEYLWFVGRVRGVEDLEGRIAEEFAFFDLGGARGMVCKDLSKGTRQKLMLAAAMLHRPRLLFLDEPFINLDPIYQRNLRERLADHVADGGTVFMASHLLDIAERLCSHVAVIHEGRIVADGAIQELTRGDGGLEGTFLRLVGDRR